jgi:predicted small metal-binding protein
VIRGKTTDEIFAKAAEHAKAVHHMEAIPPEFIEKARAAIRVAQA